MVKPIAKITKICRQDGIQGSQIKGSIPGGIPRGGSYRGPYSNTTNTSVGITIDVINQYYSGPTSTPIATYKAF